jgi:hypothetical protein
MAEPKYIYVIAKIAYGNDNHDEHNIMFYNEEKALQYLDVLNKNKNIWTLTQIPEKQLNQQFIIKCQTYNLNKK